MALFAIWHERDGEAERRHAALLDAAHIVPEHKVAYAMPAFGGKWQLAAFASTSRYYPARDQVWIDPAGGACIIHGLVWGSDTGALLDARAIGVMLDRPGARLSNDVAGEYAIARLHRDGTLEAFGDPAGLHQLFHGRDEQPVVSNRAGFAALLSGTSRPDLDSALWLSAIGYRVGTASGWTGIRQLPQNARLTASASSVAITSPPFALPERRGIAAGRALLEEGLEQAKAAVRLAADDGMLDLPITGGKDSRVVLGIALAAGLRERLTLFTRGYAGHPDTVVGEMIAARLGLPHRREPPLGSDQPADLDPHAFLALLRTIAFQADGGIGGWDNISGRALGCETLVSGHFGEVLKAYAKHSPDGPLDPIAMVRLQAPFDPLDLLRSTARERLADLLAGQMAEARSAGAEEADLPDLFYWRNRVPNWLGGIRGIKSFERQPILPLGVPALMQLAFTMTAPERKMELAHFTLLERTAPELIELPFAHQSWAPALGVPVAPPILAAVGAPLFGSWQWSLNRMPQVRAALAALFETIDIPLWEDVDRTRLIEALHRRRFEAFDLIGLLGLSIAAIHQAGLGLPVRMGSDGPVTPREPAPLPIAPVDRPRLAGHLDGAEGNATIDGDTLVPAGPGPIILNGWLQAPDWPGSGTLLEARIDGRVVATTVADIFRPDLQQAGIGDGHHAFRLLIDAADLEGATSLTLAAPGGEEGPIGGKLRISTSPVGRTETPSG